MRFNRLGRREFIALLGGTAAVWPLAARAQQAAMPVIGFLGSSTESAERNLVVAFHEGLAETGFIVGQNVGFDYRAAEGQYDRLPSMAADLVGRRVVIIAASGPPAALAAKAATATIPILFVIGYDPVDFQLVGSLNRPGGNVTGATFFTGGLGPKRLELMRQLVPNAVKIGVIVNPNSPTTEAQVRDVQAAARTLACEVHVFNASSKPDLEAAFSSLVNWGAISIIVGGDPFLMSRREQLVALAAQYSLPAIYDRREYTQVGGLMSYGTSLPEPYRKIGQYAGRILKGEKPADLPVQQPTKFELIINLKTAKALGLTVPPTLLAIADEVIE